MALILTKNMDLVETGINMFAPTYPYRGDLRTTAMLAILWAEKEYYRYADKVDFYSFALTIIKNHLINHICKESKYTFRQFYGHEPKPIFVDNIENRRMVGEHTDSFVCFNEILSVLKKQEKKVVSMLVDEFSTTKIACKIKKTRHQVKKMQQNIKNKILERFPDDVSGRGVMTKKYGKKLLDYMQIKEILNRANMGESYGNIARTLNFDASTISKCCIKNGIKRGKNNGGVQLNDKILAFVKGKKDGLQDKQIAENLGISRYAFAVAKHKHRERFEMALVA